ncbi:hypothetical protein [Vulcanisaeta sp. JCM 16161]|uniref:hypothetical protein n=1 Tax=Vulcanisaeta sp. JCM 16161 TaxID=1295372 RepID=UPI001FB2664C|nr:hypothetical protein [Vulcanisaeta sp. JCM 16161]
MIMVNVDEVLSRLIAGLGMVGGMPGLTSAFLVVVHFEISPGMPGLGRFTAR